MEINKVNYQKQDYIKANSIENSNVNSSNIPIGHKDIKKEELLVKLGVTYEQYIQLCTDFPDFPTFSIEKQKEIAIYKYTNPTTQVGKETAETSKSSVTNSETSPANPDLSLTTKNTGSDIHEDTASFNNKTFSEMPLEEKFNTYALELAKNKFLYGGQTKKTIEDWNTLSEEEKNQLIETAKKETVSSSSKDLFDSKSIGYLLEEKMINLQAANSIKTSVNDFNDDGVTSKERRLDAIHEYIFGLDNDQSSNSQKAYIKEQEYLSKALKQVSKAEGDSEYKDDVDYVLSENEITEKLKELGKTRIEFQLEYLKNKKDKGIKLSEEEQKKYDNLSKLADTDAYKMLVEKSKGRDVNKAEKADYGRMSALENSEYKDVWSSAKGIDDKIMVLDAYITKKFGNLSPEEKAKATSQLYDELLNDSNNIELVVALQGISIAKADKASQVAIAKDSTGPAPELSAINTEKFGNNEEALIGMQKVHQKLEAEDPERAEALQSTVLDYSKEEQDVLLSGIYSGAKSKKIQNKVVDKAYEASKPEDQIKILKDVKLNSTEEVIARAAGRADEVDDSIEVDVLKMLIKDSKLATQEANKKEVITRFAKENQTEGFQFLKDKIEAFFKGNEAIEQLNTLTDQIPKCHKDNQLDMHNDIMKSEYQEVKNYAAQNINKLDPTVQNDAIDTVIRTGNKEAINSAMNSMEKCSPDVQKIQIVNMAGQNAFENAGDEEKAKLLNSTSLTPEQFAKLTPSEKKDYYKRIFDKASAGEKIQMLSKLPGSQQKTVYTLICRFFPEVLSSMLKDSAMAEKMLNSGMPVDAVNKVITILQASEDLPIIKLLGEMEDNPLYKSYFADKEHKETKKADEQQSGGIDFIRNTFATSPKDLAINNKKIKSNMDLRV